MSQPGAKCISQPEEWWEVFQQHADQEGVSLSEWLGEAGIRRLPKDERKKLPKRRPAHRPKKGDD